MSLIINSIKEEKWNDISGYTGVYQASTFGNIRSFYRSQRILKPFFSKGGYKLVKLCRDRKEKTLSIHRLVAITFIPNPNNLPQVNHLDGNKRNNNILNLEWTTNGLNKKHAYSIGLTVPLMGEQRSNAKLSNQLVLIIRKLYQDFPKNILAIFFSNELNVSDAIIYDVLANRTWNILSQNEINFDLLTNFKDKLLIFQNQFNNKQKTKLPIETIRQIQQMYANGNYSTRKLGDLFDTNHTTIRAYLKVQ